jgi:hypothetical protein
MTIIMSGTSQKIHPKNLIVASPDLRGAASPGLLHVVRRLAQDFRYSAERRIFRAPPPRALERGAGQAGKGALDLAQPTAGEVPHRLAHPVEDLVEQVAVFLQVRYLRGDVVTFFNRSPPPVRASSSRS